MTEQDPHKICVMLGEFPVSDGLGFADRLELLEQMGNVLHLMALKGAGSGENQLAADIKLLTFSFLRLLQGLCAVMLMFMIAPINSLKALWLMLRLAGAGHPWLAVKSWLLAALAVNEDIIPLEMTHIHAEACPAVAMIAALAAALSGLKISFTALPPDIYRRRTARAMRHLLPRGEFIIVLSACDRAQLDQEILKKLSPPPPALVVAPGIDLNKFPFCKKIRIPGEPFKLITVGALKRKKGIHTILGALQILNERGVKFVYEIIGEGEERSRLERLAAELGVAEAVHFRGNLSRLKTIRELGQADLFILASEIAPDGDRDSMPMAILESMALGVPVVATATPGIQELIEDGETGSLAPPAEPHALAEACFALLHDLDSRQLIIMKARLFIEGRHDLLKQTRQLAELLQKMELSKPG